MGSIETCVTKAGKRYRVRYRTPDHSQAAKRGFVTMKAAELYVAENKVPKARVEWIDASEAALSRFEVKMRRLELEQGTDDSWSEALEETDQSISTHRNILRRIGVDIDG